MTLREEYKKKINELAPANFNKGQKKIAKDMLDRAEDHELDNWYRLIIQRVKKGFVFDAAPKPFQGLVSILLEDKNRRINVGDEVFDEENKLIIGENYDALKNLLLTHKGRIDVIYIDPPYNTEKAKEEGNELKSGDIIHTGKFIFGDKFTRTGWLNIMNERLLLAKQLLSSNGVIFISIDDSEQAYLKVLMDDIFGEENFVANMPRPTSIQNKNNIETIASSHDYVLVYSKLKEFNKKQFEINKKEYKYKDDNGIYKQNRNTVSKSGNNTWPIEINGKKFYPVYGKNGENKGSWNFSIDRKNELIENGGFIINGEKLYTKTYENNKRPYRSIDLINTFFDPLNSNTSSFGSVKGTNDLKKIGLNFDQPKSVDLIKELIKMHPNKNIIILDFFAGSGTTGQAVMKLNSEDNGNRKFILCTNNENGIADKITYERLHRVIKGETSEGKNDFDWLKNNKPYINEKLRVFNIESHKCSLNDDISNLESKAKEGLKMLNRNYSPSSEMNLLYDLNSLHPLEED